MSVKAEQAQWTVLVLERHGEWVDYNCGMVDFLIGSLTGTLEPEGPMTMFLDHRPTFLHWREERRLRAQGADPWPHML